MPLAAFSKFRFLWGAVEWETTPGSPYAAGETASLGADALAGVAARRAVIRIARGTGIDPAVIHFDFLNMTAGSPDDTWTTGDFTTLEGHLTTFLNARASQLGASFVFDQISWYRIGPGIVAPNPAVRVTPISIAGTGNFGSAPPQMACSITFRTSSRKSWGRTYMPTGGFFGSSDFTGGRFSNAYVDALAAAAQTLVSNAAAADFVQVVYSHTKHSLLAVEKVEVDNVPDVVRRRRWKAATYKKILP